MSSRMSRTGKVVAVLLLAGIVGACANTRSRSYSPAPPPPSQGAVSYGTVEAVDVMRGGSSGQSTGVGAVAGAVVGGVLGHQVGKGRGKDVATAGGAVAGAVIGNEIEKNQSGGGGETFYRVTVRHENGEYRTYDQTSADMRVGDRVRVERGFVSRY